MLCGALTPRLASTRGMWATEIPGVVRIWVMMAKSRRRNAALRDPARLERYLHGQLSEVERLRASDLEIATTLRDFVRMTSAAPPGVAGLLNDIRQIRHAHRGPHQATSIHVPTLVLHGAMISSCCSRTGLSTLRISKGRFSSRTRVARICSCRGSVLRSPAGSNHFWPPARADPAASTALGALRETGKTNTAFWRVISAFRRPSPDCAWRMKALRWRLGPGGLLRTSLSSRR